jgi:Common central domain of tyrosinase
MRHAGWPSLLVLSLALLPPAPVARAGGKGQPGPNPPPRQDPAGSPLPRPAAADQGSGGSPGGSPAHDRAGPGAAAGGHGNGPGGAGTGPGSAPADAPPGCQCLSTSPLPRLRKNIDCLTDQELHNLEHAFKVLQDRSAANPNDKTGYAYQVRIHGDRRVGPCEHGSELIWPWHRAFLYYFEDLLRAADPNNPDTPTKDVTLPYWDWTRPPSGTSGYPRAYENPDSPLFHPGRNVWGTGSPPPLFTDADVGLGLSDWYLFGGSTSGPGQLENRPHNDGHSFYVGGNMAFPATSVKDPVFWAHHANLDRLWDLWQQRYGVNPVLQTTTLRGWPATAVPAPVVQNFNDIRGQLHYDYCNPAPPQAVDLPLAEAVKRLPAEGARPLSLTFSTKDLHPVPPPVRHSRAQVRLLGVKTPVETTYQARVFLHPANEEARPTDADFVRKYQAAQFTLWAMGRDQAGDHEIGPSSHPPAVDLNLDVTDKYEELLRTLPAGTDLTVTLDFAAGTGRERKRVQYGQSGIEFRSAQLVVNPRPPAPKRP